MALNPNFAQQTTRALPFCLGWNYLQGIPAGNIFGLDAIPAAIAAALPSGETQVPAQVQAFWLGDGEFDSCYMASVLPGSPFCPTDYLVGGEQVFRDHTFGNGYTTQPPSNANRALFFHFHGGSWATIGMPNNLVSFGPEQATDSWLGYFPGTTPPLAFSGAAYIFVRAASTNGQPTTLSPTGVYRTTRCRIFDDNGNVTNYGFTTNPTWQMIETLLRFHIKPEQPPLAGLMAAELACFDWPSLVAHAARNGTILANGAPRFSGNMAFASDAKLAQMMETQLRNCLSFTRRRGGKISFVGEETPVSVFIASKHHVVPGTIKVTKKDVSNAPNVYVPQYRCVDIPALAQVTSVTTGASVGALGESGTFPTCTFNTVGAQPFGVSDFFFYGGSNDDSAWSGMYGANAQSSVDINGVVQAVLSANPDQIPAFGGPVAGGTATGGYVGSYSTLFKQYAPVTVQHRSAQKNFGQVAPGINPIPRQNPVFYDMGNSTFDQTNRVMQFLLNRDLGIDAAGWKAPLAGTLSLYRDAIDVNDAAAMEVEPGDLITLDPTASPAFTGVYQVVDPLTTTAPSGGGGNNPSTRQLTLQQWTPPVNFDVSASPGASYLPVPGSSLPMADVMPAAGDTPFYLLQATPETSYDSAGTGTVTVPDCAIQWLGQQTPTTYPPISLSGIPVGQSITLYLVVTNQATTPTLLLDTTSLYPGYPAGSNPLLAPAPLPYGHVVLFFGVFTDAITFGGSGSAGFVSGAAPIPVGGSSALAVIAGASAGLVFTPLCVPAGGPSPLYYGHDFSEFATTSTSTAGTTGYTGPDGPPTSPGSPIEAEDT
jgi:hypothetical protein